MTDKTGIGWTNATWNPVTGCSHVSPGCVNCYAETLSLRHGWSKKPWTAPNAAENVVLHPARITQPLRWAKPRMVFVNSMSDLFHEQVPDSFIDKVFAAMACARRHTYQVLTKRPERMRDYLTKRWRSAQPWKDAALTFGYALEFEGVSLVPFPLPNVWLGVSVEDQRRAEERIPLLQQTPAALRFLSVEPLLGPVDLQAAAAQTAGPTPSDVWLPGLDWIIVGGESGPDRREMEVEWLTRVVDQCEEAALPVFVKQDSGPRPGKQGRIPNEYWTQDFPVSPSVEQDQVKK